MSFLTDDEIYAIKEQVSAELSGLTPEEERAYLKAQTDPIFKKFGIKTVRGEKIKTLMREKAVS